MENLLVIHENEFSVYTLQNAAIVYTCKQTCHKKCPNVFPSSIF